MSDLIEQLKRQHDRVRDPFAIKKESSIFSESADLIEQLQVRVAEYERLHAELSSILSHGAEAPSLCDLVAVAREVVKERDELAAHVERYFSACVKLTNSVEFADNGEGCYVADGELMREFDAIVKDSPTTSLAERDARVAYNAIIKAINSCPSKGKYSLPLVNTCELYEYAQRVKAGKA